MRGWFARAHPSPWPSPRGRGNRWRSKGNRYRSRGNGWRWRGLAGLVAIFAVLSSSVDPAAASSDAPTTRIVSMVPSVTEILFAIGAGDSVVGDSDFCKYPDAARTKP